MPEMQDYGASTQAEATKDAVSLLAVVRRRFRGAFLVFAVTTAAVLGYQRSKPLSYEAEVELLAQNQREMPGVRMLGQNASLFGLSLGADSTDTHAALLRGEDLIVRAASELGREATTESARETLRRSVTTEVVPGTDLVRLGVTDAHPGFAADLANLIASKHINGNEERSRADALEVSTYVTQLMEEMDRRADVDADKVAAYKTSRGITDPSAEITMAMTVLGELSRSIATSRAERDGAVEQANALRRELQQTDASYVASSTIARNPLVSELEKTLAALETERAGLEATHGDGYAGVLELRRQIEQVRGQLSEAVRTVVADEIEATNPQYTELAKMLSSAESQAIAAGARLSALQPVLERERSKLSEVPAVESELGTLTRQATSSAEAWIVLFVRAQELRMNEMLVRPPLRVVSAAREPEAPIHGSVFQAALSMLVGLIGAVLLIALVEAKDATIRDGGEAHRLLGLPVLASIPRLRAGRETLTAAQPDERLARALRATRTSLSGMQEGADGPTSVLVTGVVGGEGCSSVAASLGVAFSWLGLRTLVVDGDLHSPRQHELFAVPSEPGLADVLVSDGLQAAEACSAYADALRVLPAGRAELDGTDLLAMPRASAVLAAARQECDVLIMDSSPAGLRPDASALARASDAVVLVVRPGVTPRDLALSLVANMRKRGHRLAGLVVVADRLYSPGVRVG